MEYLDGLLEEVQEMVLFQQQLLEDKVVGDHQEVQDCQIILEHLERQILVEVEVQVNQEVPVVLVSSLSVTLYNNSQIIKCL
jgi:hypothetical protein